METERLVELTVDIVSSRVANSNVSADEIISLIASVFKALSRQESGPPRQRKNANLQCRSAHQLNPTPLYASNAVSRPSFLSGICRPHIA